LGVRIEVREIVKEYNKYTNIIFNYPYFTLTYTAIGLNSHTYMGLLCHWTARILC